MRGIHILLVACFAFAWQQSTAQIDDEFDYGSIQDNTYSNRYFGFKIDLPPDWVIQNEDQISKIMDTGRDMVAGDDGNMKAMLKASEVNSATLLALFQHELGAPVDYNPNFMMIAENLSLAPGIKTGPDYLFHARKLLMQTQMEFSHIDEEFGIRNIGGREFGVMNVTISLVGMEITQVYYSTVIDGFSLSLIISWMGEEQKQAMEDILATLKFD